MIDDKVEFDYQELTQKILAGNRQAEALLIKIFYEPLIHFLNRYTGDRTRAEDFAHDTLIILIQKLRKESLNDAEKMQAYIYRTAKYVHLGWLRRRDNQVAYIPEPDTLKLAEPGIEERYIQKQEFSELCDSINNLKVSRDRDILLRRFIADESKPETCEALSLSYQHYDRVLSRARKRLKATTGYKPPTRVTTEGLHVS